MIAELEGGEDIMDDLFRLDQTQNRDKIMDDLSWLDQTHRLYSELLFRRILDKPTLECLCWQVTKEEV